MTLFFLHRVDHVLFLTSHLKICCQPQILAEIKQAALKMSKMKRYFRLCSNDLPTDKKADIATITEIADHIIEAGSLCKRFKVSNVYVSSILPRSSPYAQINRRKLNQILKDKCEQNGFIFIDNDNPVNNRSKEIILKDHVCWDGVHLNRAGSEVFCDNILYYLKHH